MTNPGVSGDRVLVISRNCSAAKCAWCAGPHDSRTCARFSIPHDALNKAIPSLTTPCESLVTTEILEIQNSDLTNTYVETTTDVVTLSEGQQAMIV